MADNTRTNLRERYLKALALPVEVTPDRTPMAGALDRAHELRKFEIENYWKRSNYFWLFQAAALTLTGLVYNRAGGQSELLLPLGLGVVSAQVGWLTARGSKFWQSNWESHVDFLEPELEGKLTQIILHQKDSVRSSVSKVNERLYSLLLLTWTTVFLGVAASLVVDFPVSIPRRALGVSGVMLLISAMLFVCWDSRSSLNPASTNSQRWWDRFRSPTHRGELAIFDRSNAADVEIGED